MHVGALLSDATKFLCMNQCQKNKKGFILSAQIVNQATGWIAVPTMARWARPTWDYHVMNEGNKSRMKQTKRIR
jgi:hypothetical protein